MFLPATSSLTEFGAETNPGVHGHDSGKKYWPEHPEEKSFSVPVRARLSFLSVLYGSARAARSLSGQGCNRAP